MSLKNALNVDEEKKKKNNKTQKKEDEQQGSRQKPTLNPYACEGQAAHVSHKTLAMLLTYSICVGHHDTQAYTHKKT